MVDVVSPAKRSEMMAGIRSRDTKPEVFVRKLLHKAGYRYRLKSKIDNIQPDIVLRQRKTAIFIHGCFWHGHERCHLYRLPKSNEAFWRKKVALNRTRDSIVVDTMKKNDWNVVIVWECAIRGRRRIALRDLLFRLESAINIRLAEKEIAGISDHKSQ